MILKLARTPAIYLVGFMGSGKTTVGRLLADRLGWSFVDLDTEIETEQGMPIAEIFDRHGEEQFRKLETEALRRRVRLVQTGRPMVVALGGGAFAQASNYELVENNGVTVWLDCPVRVAWRRVEADSGRPLARDQQRFEALYEGRRASYACADYRIEAAADDPQCWVEALLALPIF